MIPRHRTENLYEQTVQKSEIGLSDQTALQWFVVQTKPSLETRVERHLFNQEIETFLPLYQTFQTYGTRTIQRNLPLFPNYLFVRLNLSRHFHRVRWTRGVNKILGNGDQPLPVSNDVVDTIKKRAGEGNLVRLDDSWKEGDLVRIKSGPLKDLIGIFQKRMSDKERVRILLHLIGVDVPAQISRWQVQKIV